MPKKLILLYDLPDELVLIVEHPSGVRYSNQVGGFTCDRPELEGVLAPVEVSEEVKERIQGLPYPGTLGITSEIADAIDALLAAPCSYHLRVDRERLGESQEAWVFVIIASTERCTREWPPPETDPTTGHLYGFGPAARGVLTWINSD
jgi:Family of unknown function (DUF6210)